MDTMTEPETKDKKKEGAKMPTWTLKAQDQIAVDTIQFWLGRAVQLGVNKEKIAGVRKDLLAFQEYEPKKLPD